MQVGAVSDGITGVSTGVGNNLQVSVQTGASANLAGSQEMTGLVYSLNHLDLDTDGGGGVSLTTSASGNAMDVAVGDGGLIDNVITQTASGASITARSQIEAANAQAGNLSIATTAAGNTAALNSVSGGLRGRITQTGSTDVLADGGAILGYSPGVAVVVGTAAGNNIDSTSVSGGSIDLTAVQTNNAALTQASKFTAYGQVQSATTSATASGNNLNLVNEGTPTRVNSTQTNDSY
ncbi:MAG: holin, partial [Caulobacteraceae bacterium]|nr:holin [Caulobacteraceae bacterium]